MAGKVTYDVGDLVQGGSYPEAIWVISALYPGSWGLDIQLSLWWAPGGYWTPESPTYPVPARDFEPANELLVVAVSASSYE